MGEKEDIERHAFTDEEETYESDSSEPIYFSHDYLDTLLRSFGGFGITPGMRDLFWHKSTPSIAIYGDKCVARLCLSEFSDICIGNGVRDFPTDMWKRILEEQMVKINSATTALSYNLIV